MEGRRSRAWSHEWNRRWQAFHTRLLEYWNHSLSHRRVHQACAHLVAAWQRIHYAITRAKPPELLGLEEVKRRLKQAAETYAAGLAREAGDYDMLTFIIRRGQAHAARASHKRG